MEHKTEMKLWSGICAVLDSILATRLHDDYSVSSCYTVNSTAIGITWTRRRTEMGEGTEKVIKMLTTSLAIQNTEKSRRLTVQ